MNILVFSWRDPKHPLAGGAEQVMHEHMKGWINAGHNVVLFSSRVGGLNKEEVLDGVKIIRDGYQYLGVQIAGFLYYLKHRNEYDFVIDQFHGIPFFTPLYVRKPKLAVIQETARKVWFLNPLPRPLNLVIGLTGFLLEPLFFLLYRNTNVMTGSHSAKDDISRMGIPKDNITVVPHGSILPKSKIKNQKLKIKTVVYLGVLSKDKGIEDAIECFSILNQLGNFDFWVIGKAETDKYFNQLKEKVKKNGLGGKIKFWGFVSQKKKFELLAKAHVLVNPSIHEGWGLVNIEANSVWTPVVAYRVSGNVDSVKNGVSGVLCRENTPSCLVDEVLGLFADEGLYPRLQSGGVRWSSRFSWEKSKRDGLKLINGIADS